MSTICPVVLRHGPRVRMSHAAATQPGVAPTKLPTHAPDSATSDTPALRLRSLPPVPGPGPLSMSPAMLSGVGHRADSVNAFSASTFAQEKPRRRSLGA